MLEHLDFNMLATKLDKRQKKSLVGDQIEIMQYLAHWNQDYAIRALGKFIKSNRYKFSKQAFIMVCSKKVIAKNK